MQTPGNLSPISTPDGNVSPVAGAPPGQHDWNTAPGVVKGWAYRLPWLGIVLLPFAILGAAAGAYYLLLWLGIVIVPLAILGMSDLGSQVDAIAVLTALIFVFLICTYVWLNRNFKKGTSAAWIVQLFVSGSIILNSLIGYASSGSISFVGTIAFAIHTYILSQWFKPETKAWFGRS